MTDMTEDTPPRRTKIVATLGPACSSPELVRSLIQAGVDFFRINASHGDHATHGEWIARVRAESANLDLPVGILYDLQGPKIRIGRFDGPPRTVRRGDEIVIAVDRAPAEGEFPCDHELLDDDVRVGDPLLIDDGKVSFEVVQVRPGTVRCRALDDGTVASRKGINLPKSAVSTPALTNRDRRDVEFAVRAEVDAIALSFVRRADDITELQTLIAAHGASIPVVAKIEKPQALENLEAILDATWGVMVARGDLGVELSPEQVPIAQKRIIEEARRRCRPVITATQMLESMTQFPRPTRAEASDVANAVLDGTDAVMLSGETASGRYPVESVRMMARIIRVTQVLHEGPPTARRRERGIDTVPEAVADASCQVAYHLSAHAIVAFSQTGKSALLTARRRPSTPLIAYSPDPKVRNRLCLVWGVQPYLFSEVTNTEELIRNLNARLLQDRLARVGDLLVLVMGAPMDRPGRTNLIMLRRVERTDSSDLDSSGPSGHEL